MTTEYPLLMLPQPIERDRSNKPGFGRQMHRPEIATQKKRLAPRLAKLNDAF